MPMRSGLKALAFAGALSLLPGVGRADEAEASSVRAGSSGELGEAQTQIDTTLAEMRVASLRVRDQLRLTRKRGTKQQVTCVDEALSRADVALRHARALADEILEAFARGDGDAARSARGQLGELRAVQRFASVQATKCTPRPTAPPVTLVSTNVTTVKVDVDPRIPRVD